MAAAAAELQDVDVPLRAVGSAEDAAARFHGSPLVWFDRLDVDPGAEERAEYGTQCRRYLVEGRPGAPPVVWNEAVLRRVRRSEGVELAAKDGLGGCACAADP